METVAFVTPTQAFSFAGLFLLIGCCWLLVANGRGRVRPSRRVRGRCTEDRGVAADRLATKGAKLRGTRVRRRRKQLASATPGMDEAAPSRSTPGLSRLHDSDAERPPRPRSRWAERLSQPGRKVTADFPRSFGGPASRTDNIRAAGGTERVLPSNEGHRANAGSDGVQKKVARRETNQPAR